MKEENETSKMSGNDSELLLNEHAKRFELHTDGLVSIIPYNIKDDMIGLFHTEVPDALRGRGLATTLALFALNYAKDHHLKILPYCPFIAKYIKEHPEWEPYVKHFK